MGSPQPTTALNAQIRAALDQVCDPCSIAANAPLSIVDMGLVRDWALDAAGNLVVNMCVTSPSCTMSPYMVQAAEALLSAIPGIRSVRVDVDAERFWSPEDMTESGRAWLGLRRQTSVANTEVRPQQWRRGVKPDG